MRVGVLALQGDFAAHAKALEAAASSAGMAASLALVRRPRDLEGLAGLAMPGGESTTLLNLLADEGLDEAIVSFARSGGSILATCAGAILLSKVVTNPEQRSLGLLDATIERNSYGRQVDSFVGEAKVTAAGKGLLGDGAIPAVFIRAPRFLSVGPGVEVLATEGADAVLVREGNVMALTFHPELSGDLRVQRAFLEGAAASSALRAASGGLAVAATRS